MRGLPEILQHNHVHLWMAEDDGKVVAQVIGLILALLGVVGILMVTSNSVTSSGLPKEEKSFSDFKTASGPAAPIPL
jgi:hypothetical protein